AQIAPALLREPGAGNVSADELHVQGRERFGQLGRGFYAGEPAAAHDDASAFIGQLAQRATQLPGGVQPGEACRVGRSPGNGLGVDVASQRVDERVVAEILARAGEGDRVPVEVDAGDG